MIQNMKPNPKSQIIQAERVGGGVVMTFDDGRSFLFKANMLRAQTEHAEDITDLPGIDIS